MSVELVGVTNKIVRDNSSKSMFYQLFDHLADNFSEDVAFYILDFMGFVEITFDKNNLNSDNYYWNYTIKHKLFNKIKDYNREVSLINCNKLRNFIFRHNIKVYNISEVIYDNKEKKFLLPKGRMFEHRPIFKHMKQIYVLSYKKDNDGTRYLIIDSNRNDNFENNTTINYNITKIY